MILVLIALLMLAIFTPFIVLAGRQAPCDKRMLARFALLQSGAPGAFTFKSGDALLTITAQQPNSWLDPLFSRLTTALKLTVLLRQADSQKNAKHTLLLCLFASLVVFLLTLVLLHMFWIALPLAALASYAPIQTLKVKRNRRVSAMNKVLPDVIDMMSRALRAGHSLGAAMGIIAEQAPEPARAEFSELFRKQQFGLPMRDALLDLLNRTPSQDLRVLVTGILVQRDTGGNLTQILDRSSAVIRERLKLQGDIRVHTAQGRMTGWVLAMLPVAMLVMINFISPGYSKPLTNTPFGQKCLYAGAVLLAVGIFMIRRIVNKIEV